MATAVLYKSETIYLVDFFFLAYHGPVFEISFCPFPEEFPADSHEAPTCYDPGCGILTLVKQGELQAS